MIKETIMKEADSDFDAIILTQVAARSSQVYFIYDVEAQKLRYLNPAAETLWQVPSQSLPEEPERLLKMVHPEDLAFLKEHYQNLLDESGQPPEVERLAEEMAAPAAKPPEFRLRLPGDTVKWICLTVYSIQREKQRLLAGYAEDITARKEYLEATLKFNAKKNAILEILSHELAAPFANIQGLATLLEHSVSEGETVEEWIRYIRENAQKGSDLIRNFVDAEFLESSRVVLHKERTDLVAIFRTMLEDYQRAEGLIAKQFILSSPAPSIYLSVDTFKFMQAINNLISNAIKFTPDNGRIEVSIQERPSEATSAPAVLISVADNGIGIPAKLQPVVFDKFTKARRPGLRGEKTTGLGMSVIKTIVELHQGRVWFKSTEGEGTTFYVEVPKEQE